MLSLKNSKNSYVEETVHHFSGGTRHSLYSHTKPTGQAAHGAEPRLAPNCPLRCKSRHPRDPCDTCRDRSVRHYDSPLVRWGRPCLRWCARRVHSKAPRVRAGFKRHRPRDLNFDDIGDLETFKAGHTVLEVAEDISFWAEDLSRAT